MALVMYGCCLEVDLPSCRLVCSVDMTIRLTSDSRKTLLKTSTLIINKIRVLHSCPHRQSCQEVKKSINCLQLKKVVASCCYKKQVKCSLNLISHKTMSRVTLHELSEEVGVSPAQLDKACTSKHLRDITLFLDSW